MVKQKDDAMNYNRQRPEDLWGRATRDPEWYSTGPSDIIINRTNKNKLRRDPHKGWVGVK